MNVYDAILKAADSIERNPALFRFSSACFSHDCGSPMCALGWIGHHLAAPKSLGHLSEIVIPPLLGLPSFENGGYSIFYRRLDSITKCWTRNTGECARALRAYANKYHRDIISQGESELRPKGIPEDVRAIFDGPVREAL